MATTIPVQQDDNGDSFITLPPEVLKELGWNEKTMLSVVLNDDGTIVMRKKTDWTVDQLQNGNTLEWVIEDVEKNQTIHHILQDGKVTLITPYSDELEKLVAETKKIEVPEETKPEPHNSKPIQTYKVPIPRDILTTYERIDYCNQVCFYMQLCINRIKDVCSHRNKPFDINKLMVEIDDYVYCRIFNDDIFDDVEYGEDTNITLSYDTPPRDMVLPHCVINPRQIHDIKFHVELYYESMHFRVVVEVCGDCQN
jgi:bifunctional DNA-binding transcriptional regulator/antitoxin component of YhaV-PrlF toxin-antitoxin module